MGVTRRATITAAAAVAACMASACGGSGAGGTHPGIRTGSDASTSPATDQSAIRALIATGATGATRATGATPVSSPAYRKLIETAAGKEGLSPPIAAKVTDCIVKRETGQGYRILADIARSETSRARALEDARECTTQAFPAG